MKLLLDETFPAYSTRLSKPGILVERYGQDRARDEDLVDHAAVEGYDAVIVLGAEAATRQRLLHAASRAGVALVVVVARDSDKGDRYLESGLARVSMLVHRDQLITVRASGVKDASLSSHLGRLTSAAGGRNGVG